MIRRTIFIKLRDPEVPRRAQIGAEIADRWSNGELNASLTVGLPADDHAADAWDLFLELGAESLPVMEATLAADEWADDLWPWLEALAVVTKGWNFDVD